MMHLMILTTSRPPPDLDDDSDFDPDDFEYAGAPKMPDYVKDSIKRQYKGGLD